VTSDLRLVVGGLKSFIPSISRSTGTGGTIAPRYCYGIWLRHLRMIAKAGVDHVRDVVVEIGPGDSVGTGLAALLTTGKRYIALDVVPHAAAVVQSSLLDAIADLLRAKTPIPDANEFPKVFPRLPDYRFPSDVLDGDRLARRLAPSHIEQVRSALDHMGTDDPKAAIRYACPWSRSSVPPKSADLVFSQAALQEIDNRGGALRSTFESMATWLKPGGIVSHQVDLGMYGAEPWDRHWTYGDMTWTMIRGQRPNYINREPLSTYEELCEEFGFDVALLDVVEETPSVARGRLAPRFRPLDERDRTARAVHIVAVKR